MEKKTYTTPKLTEHGSVINETKGVGADSYEFMGRDVWETRGFGVKLSFTKPVKDK
jgi:hypothetical protein